MEKFGEQDLATTKDWLEDDEGFEAFLENLDRRINKANALTAQINQMNNMPWRLVW